MASHEGNDAVEHISEAEQEASNAIVQEGRRCDDTGVSGMAAVWKCKEPAYKGHVNLL